MMSCTVSDLAYVEQSDQPRRLIRALHLRMEVSVVRVGHAEALETVRGALYGKAL
jgi:hypothetical protein